jgi:hypothetical protein
MRLPRLAIALTAAGTMLATLVGSTPAGGATDQVKEAACRLLADAHVREAISAAGEFALAVRCGLIARPTATGPARPVAGATSRRAPDVLVNDRTTDTWPHITQSEATVAAGGRVLLAGWNDSGQFLSTGDLSGYGRSDDDGRTWTDMGVPTTPLGVVNAVFGDPVLVADRNRDDSQTSVFYYANLGELSNGTSIISVHKTINGGMTWAQAANASPGAAISDAQDKEWIAVDTRATGTGAGNVYVCWSRFTFSGQEIRLSRSTDGGATFTIVQTDLSADSDVQGCQVLVDPTNGNVYVSWTNRNNGVSPRPIKFRRSTNQGTTFSAEMQIGSAAIAETLTNCGGTTRTAFVDSEASGTTRAVRSTSFSELAVSPGGELYAVWHRATLAGGDKADISFVKSIDGGVTFSAETRINSAVTGQQFMPSIDVNRRNIVRVMYYSTQNSPTDRLIDVYSVRSNNGGVTWSAPNRATDVSFDRPATNPNFDNGGGLTLASCYMGDYNTVDAADPGLGNARFHLVWGDNRLDGDPGQPGVQPDPDIRHDV